MVEEDRHQPQTLVPFFVEIERWLRPEHSHPGLDASRKRYDGAPPQNRIGRRCQISVKAVIVQIEITVRAWWSVRAVWLPRRGAIARVRVSDRERGEA